MKIGKIIALVACACFAAVGIAFLSACERKASENTQINAQSHFPLRFSDGKIVRVRLALTDIERTRGLMGCRGLGADEGMLFVYPFPDARGFWMKHVPIDLDIGYFDASGKLREVYTMKADDPEVVYSKSDDIQYCLEMRSAWFKENNALPEQGVSIDLDDVKAGMKARGFRTR